MKRIVELSENDYKALKEDGVHNHLALADEIIAHSEPYEEKPQGDLISRSDIKDHISELLIFYIGEFTKCPKCLYDEASGADLANAILNAIDNAPTVEPEKVYLAKVQFDEEKLKEIVQTQVIDKINSGELVLKDERPQEQWIPVSERLPEEKINPYTTDFDEVLCTTDWGDVQAFKFGTPILHHEPHFWLGGSIMDEHIIAWQYKPEPYKKEGAE